MRQNILQKNTLPVVTIILSFLVLISGVLLCDRLMAIRDNTPSTDFSIDIGEPSALRTIAPREALLCAGPMFLTAASSGRTAQSSVSVYDENQTWSKEITVSLFEAEYENETGKVTVRSAYGDKIIAPGTANSYHFYVRNNGSLPIEYILDTTAELVAVTKGNQYRIPLEARFYSSDEEYLLGSENGYAKMEELDGIHDEGELSVNHYTRYTLDWKWPFEGDDTLDTMLGNLSVDGDTIKVAVTIQVTATGEDAASGGIPQTGDNSRIGLWMIVMVTSLMILIFLLFTRNEKTVPADERSGVLNYRKDKHEKECK